MIKTVKGVMAKLTTAREMGYKYCKVAVDNNNIGCALIKDILDSISYCHTPGGKIRSFIHRGYEYTVEDGIEITILTDEEFLEHYMGLPCNKDIVEKEEERVRRDALENASIEQLGRLTKDEPICLDEMIGARDALRNSIKEKPSQSNELSRNLFEDGEATRSAVTLGESKESKSKKGLFARFKDWLKGDVGYKR